MRFMLYGTYMIYHILYIIPYHIKTARHISLSLSPFSFSHCVVRRQELSASVDLRQIIKASPRREKMEISSPNPLIHIRLVPTIYTYPRILGAASPTAQIPPSPLQCRSSSLLYTFACRHHACLPICRLSVCLPASLLLLLHADYTASRNMMGACAQI